MLLMQDLDAHTHYAIFAMHNAMLLKSVPVTDTPLHVASAATGYGKSSSTPAALWSLLPKGSIDRAAVVCVDGGVEVSHRKLQELSLSLAGKLTRDLGYGVGDKLALVLGGNYVESVIVQLAAAAAGITVVTAAKPEDNVLAGCRGMVVSANVLADRKPQGLLEGETHSPILSHSLQSLDCQPIEMGDSASDDHGVRFAVYGGAKATDRVLTQVRGVVNAFLS